MSPARRSALVAGILYLLTFVSIPTLALYGAIHDPNWAGIVAQSDREVRQGMDRKTRQVLGDVAEAAAVVLVLGVIIAGLYRWFTGELPWWFVAGEGLGGLLGFTLLVSTMPKRH